MDPDLKNKWITALRSGDYRQGFLFLRYDECFCSLGVLCDVMGGQWEERATLYEVKVGGVLLKSHQYDIPGLPHPWRKVMVDLNDAGASFEEIASFIEENL